MARLRVISMVSAIALFFACDAVARAQGLASCTSSIPVLFNQYSNAQIATGSTIWFSSVLVGVQSDADNLGTAPVRIDVRQSRIFGEWPYVITMPDSTIVLDPATSEPQRWWVGNSSWSLTYAPAQIPEAFYNGMPFTVPEPFVPGGPVTWTATFTASRPGITVRWAWGAAVYSKFGVNGHLLVKALTAPVAPFENDDRAGTPELFKQYVIPGAMGTGAPQYAGARSESASVRACPVSEPPPPTAPMQHAPPTRQYHVLVRSSAPSRGAPSFASQISQRIVLADGSVAQAVDRCYAADLCVRISYVNGDRLSIYSEGAAYCKPYVLYFLRTNGDRTVYGFSRDVDHDQPSGAFGSRCVHSRTTHIVMEGGRVKLTISKNADGTLRFHVGVP